MQRTNLPFDRVVITANGRVRELSADAFLALPLNQRVAHILGRHVEFFATSVSIDRGAALRALRELSEPKK